MRVIAGLYKGRTLLTPKDDAIRPTSDRTREALFNILLHSEPGRAALVGGRVADICCGTGALGIEALSRGAAHVTFVDQSKKALELVQQNLNKIGAASQANLLHADATRVPAAREPYSLILIDPPYGSGLLVPLLKTLSAQGWLAPHTLISFEEAKTFTLPELAGFEVMLNRAYGKNQLFLLQQKLEG